MQVRKGSVFFLMVFSALSGWYG